MHDDLTDGVRWAVARGLGTQAIKANLMTRQTLTERIRAAWD
jgi:hypothetical protein